MDVTVAQGQLFVFEYGLYSVEYDPDERVWTACYNGDAGDLPIMDVVIRSGQESFLPVDFEDLHLTVEELQALEKLVLEHS